MNSAKNKTYILWTLFFLTIVIPLINITGGNLPAFNLIKFCFPLCLLLWHSIWVFGFKRSLLILLPPFIIGLIFEIIGVNYGVMFGGHYFYNPDTLGPLLFGVPILIPFFWSFFVYTGYTITSSSLTWLNSKKPSKINKKIWLLALLVLIDGLLVVAIDLFMDPIMVAGNDWTWINGGAYFGVPIGNFIGWFIVAILSTGIFRTCEYYFPPAETRAPKSILLIPAVGYGLLGLLFLTMALNLHLNSLAIIGVLLMLPVSLINLILYAKSKRN